VIIGEINLDLPIRGKFITLYPFVTKLTLFDWPFER